MREVLSAVVLYIGSCGKILKFEGLKKGTLGICFI